jgi:hypothetical protein
VLFACFFIAFNCRLSIFCVMAVEYRQTKWRQSLCPALEAILKRADRPRKLLAKTKPANGWLAFGSCHIPVEK